MSDFTYNLPFSEETLKKTALEMLRKKDSKCASLLCDSKMSIQEQGTSYYYDRAKNSRWNAIAIEIKFLVPMKNIDSLDACAKNDLRRIFNDLIPAEVGYDVKAIKYIPDLSEQSCNDIAETVITTLETIPISQFAQAIEHYGQAKRQLVDTTDERRRKDAVRDCASAMESIIKILGKDDDIKIASKNLRASKQWGIDDIVKDGDSIFNNLHRLYPDLRHGAQQTSSMSLNEAKYWIDRISAYISYVVRVNEDISWLS